MDNNFTLLLEQYERNVALSIDQRRPSLVHTSQPDMSDAYEMST